MGRYAAGRLKTARQRQQCLPGVGFAAAGFGRRRYGWRLLRRHHTLGQQVVHGLGDTAGGFGKIIAYGNDEGLLWCGLVGDFFTIMKFLWYAAYAGHGNSPLPLYLNLRIRMLAA